MKKALSYCCASSLALLFFLFSYTTLFAQSEERIVHFDALLQVQTDASVRVIETIQYDFGPNTRHGIYRDIPDTFTDAQGSKHSLSLSDIWVTDEAGRSLPVQISSQSDDLRIQMGDPDVTVGGRHTYVLSYVAHNAISFLPDRDELYWSVTGNKWDVPIEVVTSQVLLVWGDPLLQGFYRRDLHTACYRGVYGDTTPCDEIELIPSVTEENAVGTTSSDLIQMIEFSSTGLTSYQGVTIAVGFPKGVVSETVEPSFESDIYILTALVFLIPCALGFFAFWTWFKKGRDPRGRGTIIPEYAPPGDLSALESATILYGRIRPRDISSGIIELAVKGAITIEEVERKVLFFFPKKDYRLRQTTHTVSLSDIQRDFLVTIFYSAKRGEDGDILISEIEANTFFGAFNEDKRKIGYLLMMSGYFTRNPYRPYGWWNSPYGIIGVMLLILLGERMAAVVSVFSGADWIYWGWLISLSISLCILYFFDYFLTQKTEKGALARDALLGLKKYITVAEKDRIEFHNAPAKTPELFEKLLPYAMVFGVTKIWTKEFEGMMRQPPSWYTSPGGDWNMEAFSSHMNTFSGVFATASTPQSSGAGSGWGGFSGGGGGGGGGGSW